MNGCSAPNTTKYAQIIEAAVHEFQEKGFASASMDRVSSRAQVSKRTVYKYFESKENLFRSIVEELSSRFADLNEIRYVPGRPIREQLVDLAWAEGRLLISCDVMSMARMIISETLRHPELAEAAQGKIDQKPVISSLLRTATEDGQLKVEDPDSAADEFLALIKAKAFWPFIFGGNIVSEDEMSVIVEACVEMIMCRYGA